MAINDDFTVWAHVARFEQGCNFLRRAKAPVLQKLLPLDMHCARDVPAALAAWRIVLASPFEIVPHVDDRKTWRMRSPRKFVERHIATGRNRDRNLGRPHGVKVSVGKHRAALRDPLREAAMQYASLAMADEFKHPQFTRRPHAGVFVIDDHRTLQAHAD